MQLKDKIAVVYGAGGVGRAVAKAFAKEGATVFLAGRSFAKVQAVASEIGSGVEAAEVDALEESSIEEHLRSITERLGKIDISFNAIGIRNTTLQGVPLAEIETEQFMLPIMTYAKSYFLTSRLAARRMIPQGSGVIMTVTSIPARTGFPLMGGVGPAMSTVEGLTRGLSAELAPHGIRVIGLRPEAMPDSSTIEEVFGIHARLNGISHKQFHERMATRTHSQRLTSLSEMANVASFMASDAASSMTGTVVNLSMGSLDD